MVPFWNQFDQLDLIITSTKVAPVFLDPQSGEEVGENYPLPCTAVYAKRARSIVKPFGRAVRKTPEKSSPLR